MKDKFEIIEDREELFRLIIQKVDSVECKKYLENNANSFTLLQWGTIVIESACYTNVERLSFIASLEKLANSTYEQKLFSLALRDLQKHRFTTEKVEKYYLENDPREDRSPFAFNEAFSFPIEFKRFDIVSYVPYYESSEETMKLVIGLLPYGHEKPIEFCDACYLAYSLDKRIGDVNELIDIQEYPHVFELKRIGLEDLNEEEVENLEIIKLLFNQWLEQNS